MNRYERQMILPEVGATGQARLQAARVLVVGAGGLATPALPALAGAGIGHLTIVDADVVDRSNLHRQTMFTEAEVGQEKAEVAAARCRALNSGIEVVARSEALTPANVAGLTEEADLVLDCADSYAASYTLSDYCFSQRTPLISASVLGTAGYVGGFCGGAPSLRALFSEAPDSGASCATAGVLGPVVAIVGAMQAQMALAHLLGLEPSPLGQLTRFDGLSLRSTSFRFDTAPEPERAPRFVAPDDLTGFDQIFELRDVTEAPEPAHPGAQRISPEELSKWLSQAADRTGNAEQGSARLALCCATGLRAWRTAEIIKPHWPGEIVLVAATTS